ncbi:phosphoglycolate phosphatase [Atopomonas sediminilitoris]|uniref:phosphoglycolate phosphatase n=1 Tax=Atopomonas sediminilitoris TaxID=2919919 RepID=UPI001F4EC95A|nr:phosphoglycolate phosphatase [Atopomonas sediminilitoris]MCJ8170281.1 phosphoglycolate phosphatase [Atopomonas sediminilitoris]
MTALERLCGGWPQLVMFDLDGTLVDSVPDLAAAIDVMLLQLGRAPAGVAQVRDWVGNGALVLVRRALANSFNHEQVDEAQAAQALALFEQAYAKPHAATRVYPGALEFVQTLAARGTPLALVTNKPSRFLPALLAQVGMADVFRWQIGGDTFAAKKPDPFALHWLLQQAAAPAAQTLFVGDSRNDVLAARAAGVPMAAVSYGYNHGRPIGEEAPDWLGEDLRALLVVA